ncbi:hypothetical protein [Streptomyces sp. NPDC047973]|uniref:hypothetical protein n=1 Tax=Streptomyces sp. NPDC047973 TaxID=3155383 RepID=UPI0034178883
MAEPDALNALEEEAQSRSSRGRQPGGSRKPRRQPSAAELAAQREEERLKREAARLQRETGDQSHKGGQVQPSQELAPVPAASPKKQTRPKSIPFYPNPEDEDFLWAVAEAATARREKVPATAVLRLALRRLSDQMTPSEVVRALSGPVQTEGKSGRPRR